MTSPARTATADTGDQRGERPSPVIWLMGLSRSGKSTIAEGVAAWLSSEHDRRAQVLDGRFVRDELGNCFGYSKDERIKVSRVLTVMAKLLSRNGVVPIVTAITPHAESRELNREELDRYIEIYVDCSVETCMQRDDEGLYRRALRGDLSNYIGVDVPFEIPKAHDLRIVTEHDPPEASVRRAVDFLTQVLELDTRGLVA